MNNIATCTNRQWLVDLRQKKNLLQKDVALNADISIQQYSYIETGQRNPSPATAKKIADVLGFPWTLFFEDFSQ